MVLTSSRVQRRFQNGTTWQTALGESPVAPYAFMLEPLSVPLSLPSFRSPILPFLPAIVPCTSKETVVEGTEAGNASEGQGIKSVTVPSPISLSPLTPCPWRDASPSLPVRSLHIYLLCNIYRDLVFNNCHSNISFLNPFRSAAVAILNIYQHCLCVCWLGCNLCVIKDLQESVWDLCRLGEIAGEGKREQVLEPAVWNLKLELALLGKAPQVLSLSALSHGYSVRMAWLVRRRPSVWVLPPFMGWQEVKHVEVSADLQFLF